MRSDLSDQELSFLVVNFLAQRPEFAGSAAMLAEEMQATGALGRSFDFRGEARSASFEDRQSLHAWLPSDQLKRLLAAPAPRSESLLKPALPQITAQQAKDGRQAARRMARALMRKRKVERSIGHIRRELIEIDKTLAASELSKKPQAAGDGAPPQDENQKESTETKEAVIGLLDLATSPKAEGKVESTPRLLQDKTGDDDPPVSTEQKSLDAASPPLKSDPPEASATEAKSVAALPDVVVLERNELSPMRTEAILRRKRKHKETSLQEYEAEVIALAAEIAELREVASAGGAFQRSLRLPSTGLPALCQPPLIGALLKAATSPRGGFTGLLKHRSACGHNLSLASVPRLLSKLRCAGVVNGHLTESVYCIAVDATGRYAVSGADDGLVKVWLVPEARLVCTLRGHKAVITDIAVSPDNALLASASEDKTIRVWDLSCGATLAVLNGHTHSINFVRFDNFSGNLISVSDDGTMRVWNVASLPYRNDKPRGDTQGVEYRVLPHRITGSKRSVKVKCLSVNPLGGHVATGGEDGVARIFRVPNFRTHDPRHVHPAHNLPRRADDVFLNLHNANPPFRTHAVPVIPRTLVLPSGETLDIRGVSLAEDEPAAAGARDEPAAAGARDKPAAAGASDEPAAAAAHAGSTQGGGKRGDLVSDTALSNATEGMASAAGKTDSAIAGRAEDAEDVAASPEEVDSDFSDSWVVDGDGLEWSDDDDDGDAPQDAAPSPGTPQKSARPRRLRKLTAKVRDQWWGSNGVGGVTPKTAAPKTAAPKPFGTPPSVPRRHRAVHSSGPLGQMALNPTQTPGSAERRRAAVENAAQLRRGNFTVDEAIFTLHPSGTLQQTGTPNAAATRRNANLQQPRARGRVANGGGEPARTSETAPSAPAAASSALGTSTEGSASTADASAPVPEAPQPQPPLPSELEAFDVKQAWEYSQSALALQLSGHIEAITDVRYSHRGDRLVTAAQKEGTARIWFWDYAMRQTQQLVLNVARDAVGGGASSSSGTAASELDARSARGLTRSSARRRGRNSISIDNVEWSAHDEYVITAQSRKSAGASADGGQGNDWVQLVKVWDSLSGSLLRKLNGHSQMVQVMRTHPICSSILLTAGYDGKLTVWNVETGEAIACHYNHVRQQYDAHQTLAVGELCAYHDGCWTADGTQFIIGDSLGQVSFLAVTENLAAKTFAEEAPEQYFRSDYEPLMWDSWGYTLESHTGLPPHLTPAGALMNFAGHPYDFAFKSEDPMKELPGPAPLTAAQNRSRTQALLGKQSALEEYICSTMELRRSSRFQHRIRQKETAASRKGPPTPRKASGVIGPGDFQEMQSDVTFARMAQIEHDRQGGSIDWADLMDADYSPSPRQPGRGRTTYETIDAEDDGEDQFEDGWDDVESDSEAEGAYAFLRPRVRNRRTGRLETDEGRRLGGRSRPRSDDAPARRSTRSERSRARITRRTESNRERRSRDRASRARSRRSRRRTVEDFSDTDSEEAFVDLVSDDGLGSYVALSQSSEEEEEVGERAMREKARGKGRHQLDNFDPSVRVEMDDEEGNPDGGTLQVGSTDASGRPLRRSTRHPQALATSGRPNGAFQPNPNPDTWVKRDDLVCAFCHRGHLDGWPLPGPTLGPHPLLAGNGERLWAHDQCALLSPQAFQDEAGNLYNIMKEIRRGRVMDCVLCNQRGATVGCYRRSCRGNYHVHCAMETGWDFTSGEPFRCPNDRRGKKKAKQRATRATAAVPKSRSSGKGRKKSRPDEFSAEPTCDQTAGEKIAEKLDRAWLQKEKRSDPSLDTYAPQMGDEVYYFPQGHAEFLKAFPDHVALPWQSVLPDRYGVVRCQVVGIRYGFPDVQEAELSPSVLAIVTLLVLGVPASTEELLQSGGEIRAVHPRREDFKDVRDQELTFSVKLRDYSDLAPFLCFAKGYEDAVSREWAVGQRLKIPFLSDGRVDDYSGTVIRIAANDAAWGAGPWNSVVVLWDDAAEDSEINPWEARFQDAKGSASEDLPDEGEAAALRWNIAEAQRDAIAASVQSLSQLSCAKHFRKPVDLGKLPLYSRMVPNPIDLGLIVRRLRNDYYNSLDGLAFEAKLLYDNCLVFNRDDSEIAKQAKEVYENLDAIVEDARSPKRSEKPSPSRKRSRRIGAAKEGSPDASELRRSALGLRLRRPENAAAASSPRNGASKSGRKQLKSDHGEAFAAEATGGGSTKISLRLNRKRSREASEAPFDAADAKRDDRDFECQNENGVKIGFSIGNPEPQESREEPGLFLAEEDPSAAAAAASKDEQGNELSCRIRIPNGSSSRQSGRKRGSPGNGRNSIILQIPKRQRRSKSEAEAEGERPKKDESSNDLAVGNAEGRKGRRKRPKETAQEDSEDLENGAALSPKPEEPQSARSKRKGRRSPRSRKGDLDEQRALDILGGLRSAESADSREQVVSPAMLGDAEDEDDSEEEHQDEHVDEDDSEDEDDNEEEDELQEEEEDEDDEDDEDGWNSDDMLKSSARRTKRRRSSTRRFAVRAEDSPSPETSGLRRSHRGAKPREFLSYSDDEAPQRPNGETPGSAGKRRPFRGDVSSSGTGEASGEELDALSPRPKMNVLRLKIGSGAGSTAAKRDPQSSGDDDFGRHFPGEDEAWPDVPESKQSEVASHVIKQIKERDSEKIFVDPVDVREAPFYDQIVTNPMWIKRIVEKARGFQRSGKRRSKNLSPSEVYRSLEDFRQDILLMCNNATLYNTEDAVAFQTAVDILQWLPGMFRIACESLGVTEEDLRPADSPR